MTESERIQKILEETKKLSEELFNPRSKELQEALDEVTFEGSPQNLVDPDDRDE